MANFEIFKLSADIVLIGAVVFLAYRIMINGTIGTKTSQLLILEASLKGLIKDAEASGKALNEELAKRQNNLERLLGDLSALENRLTAQSQSLEKQTQKVSDSFAPIAPSFEQAVRNHSLEKTNAHIRKTAQDVRALAKHIEVSRVDESNRIETKDEEISSNINSKEAPDERLGVLGGIKRQVQTL